MTQPFESFTCPTYPDGTFVSFGDKLDGLEGEVSAFSYLDNGSIYIHCGEMPFTQDASILYDPRTTKLSRAESGNAISDVRGNPITGDSEIWDLDERCRVKVVDFDFSDEVVCVDDGFSIYWKPGKDFYVNYPNFDIDGVPTFDGDQIFRADGTHMEYKFAEVVAGGGVRFADRDGNRHNSRVFLGEEVSHEPKVFSLDNRCIRARDKVYNIEDGSLGKILFIDLVAATTEGCSPVQVEWENGERGYYPGASLVCPLGRVVGLETRCARSIDDLVDSGFLKPDAAYYIMRDLENYKY